MRISRSILVIACLTASTAAADPVAEANKFLAQAKEKIAAKDPGQGLAPCRRAMERQPAVEKIDKALAATITTTCTRDIYVAQLELGIAAIEAERSTKKKGALMSCMDGSPKSARMKLLELPKLDAPAKALTDKYRKLCPL